MGLPTFPCYERIQVTVANSWKQSPSQKKTQMRMRGNFGKKTLSPMNSVLTRSSIAVPLLLYLFKIVQTCSHDPDCRRFNAFTLSSGSYSRISTLSQDSFSESIFLLFSDDMGPDFFSCRFMPLYFYCNNFNFVLFLILLDKKKKKWLL